MKNAKFRSIAAAVAAVAAAAFSRVAPAADLETERSAGIYHSYEFEDVRDTPPPEGYVPFYVSHYGRHGSRFQRNRDRLKACAAMKTAGEAGLLTPLGRDVQGRLDRLAKAHEGMFKCLAMRGAEEHKRLARRMFERFPAVFADGGRVRCQSTTKYRCLASMANFATALKGAAPALDFSFETGERSEKILLGGADDRDESLFGDIGAILEPLRKNVAGPGRLMSALFTDPAAAEKAVGAPAQFAEALFDAASACQSLARELDGMDVYDVFTGEELASFSRFDDCRYYAGMGNSVEFGDRVARRLKALPGDVVARADAAIADGGVCADLRFGHDSGLLPLTAFIGLEGPGDRVPVAEAWERCPLWRCMPMASNVQMVFYRKDGADVLVKVLFNERETAIRGLSPVAGPYYRWQDLRVRLERGVLL